MPKADNETMSWPQKIVALIFAIVIVSGSIYMKSVGFITEPSLVVLILAGFVIGLFLAFSDRVEYISLKGELALAKIERKHADIIEVEASVKEVAKSTIEMIEVTRATSWAPTEEENQKYNMNKKHLEALLEK